MRTASLRAVFLLAIGLPLTLYAQADAQRYASAKNNFSFAIPAGYTAETSFDGDMEIVALHPPQGDAGIMMAFVGAQPSSTPAAPLAFPDLVQAGGMPGCQGICAIKDLTPVPNASGRDVLRYSIEQRMRENGSEGTETSRRLGPFFAVHIHPGSDDLLLLTPNTQEAESVLVALLPTLQAPVAPASTGSAASPPPTSSAAGSAASAAASQTASASASGGTTPSASSAPAASSAAASAPAATPPEPEEKLLFGIFSTNLSRSQIFALIGAFVFFVLFVIERVVRSRKEAREQANMRNGG